MDAAYTSFKKTVLFLSFTVLCMGLVSTRAQAQSIITCGAVNLTSQTFQTTCSVASSGANIPYTGQINYSDSTTNWLNVNPLSSTATSAGMLIAITAGGASLDASQTSHSATITLTPAAGAPVGSTGGTISVTYTPGAGTGGGGTGSGTITSTSLQTFCPTAACASVQYFTLSTASSTAIPFTVSPPSWLNVAQISGNSGSVSSGSPAQFSVSVNNYNAATSGQSIIIYYGSTSLSIPLTVTNSIGGGSGSLTFSPSTLNLYYNTGGSAPTGTVSFTDSGATYFEVTSVSTASGDPAWLLVSPPNGSPSTAFSYVSVGNGSYFNVSVNTSVLASMSNGTHYGTVNFTDYVNAATQDSAAYTVILNINNGSGGGGSGTLTISPSSLTLPTSAVGSTTAVTGSASITSSVSGNLNYTLGNNCTNIYPSFSSNFLSAGTGVSFTVTGYPSGLTAQTENCSITITLQSGSTVLASQILPVSWTIGSGSGGSGSASNAVLPTALNFSTENGNSAPLTPQYVTITAAGAWTATPSVSWITVAASGTSSGTSTTLISVSASGLAPSASPYTGTVTFNTTAGQQVVTVSLLDTASTPVIYGFQTPGFSLQAVSGNIIGGYNPIQVLSSDGSAIAYSAASSASWIVLNGASSGTTNTGNSVSFGIDPSTLANGVYSGNITITANGAANSPLSIPVVLTVTGSSASGGGSGSLTFSPTSLTFNAQVNGTVPPTQTITVTNPSNVSYYAYASGTNNGITWLSVSPTNSYVSGYSYPFTVSVNQSGLPLGTYTGTINFYSTSGSSQSATVTLNVSTTGSSTAISVSPASLSFSGNQGGAVPLSQQLTITSTSGASVSGTVTTTEQTGASYNWLSANTSTFVTGSPVTISVNQANLTAGTYTGAVVLTPTGGGTATTVTVTLTVAGLPVISTSPSTLNLSYSVGGTAPTASINVNGGTGLTYTASVSSTCNCLSVTPTSGNTTAAPNLTVSLNNPTNLTAGTYTGTVTVSGTGNATGSSTTTVTLTVTAPLPTISAVVNAASGVGGAVSPGEIVSIFAPASNPIGPATGVGLSGSNLVNGNVPTTGLGGVKVTFNGYPAAVLYASASQINAVVPYEVAGFSGFPVVVSYLGQTSNGYNLQTTSTVPGIFTQNASGSGPADVINSDGVTVNGPNHPAAKGSTVSVYLTGEGALTPKVQDGAVTCSAGCSSISQIPIPLLPVAVLVDGQPASVVFYGEAPGLVSGLMQVNFTIPSTVHSGAVSLVVTVGSNQSQQNVTIAVQ